MKSAISISTLIICCASTSPANAQQALDADRDAFYWLSEINKASTVMVTETGIVPPKLGREIAVSVYKVIVDANADRKLRSGDYLKVEPLLIEAGGADVTRLHSGRSRQDIGATSRRLTQRDQILATMLSLDKARSTLLDFAAKHPNAIIPAYTWGVQAQPTSFGHYILGYTEVLERQAVRMRSAFAATNQSPLGSAALGTSSFPVNRARLAELLGFDQPIVNSLDANQLSPIDTGAEQVGVSASIALIVGTLASDLEAQYHVASPWIMLTEGELTGVSSIMPQKRNPVAIQQLRVTASDVVGESVKFYVKAHNVPAGMGDYKGVEPERALAQTAILLEQLHAVVLQLNFNEQRALEEVNSDYSATAELADILQREADVPFRVGHHFASELVTFGRGAGLRPSQIKYSDAKRIYAGAVAGFGLKDAKLPLTEAQFRKALTAENMVASSKGLGGPQPSEVIRMLSAQKDRLDQDRAWVEEKRQRLKDAASRLQSAFDNIRSGN